MYITYWYGPLREETNAGTYEAVKNAGFTLAGPMKCSGSTVEENLWFLNICQAKGLKTCFGRIPERHVRLVGYTFDEPNSELFPQLGNETYYDQQDCQSICRF